MRRSGIFRDNGYQFYNIIEGFKAQSSHAPAYRIFIFYINQYIKSNSLNNMRKTNKLKFIGYLATHFSYIIIWVQGSHKLINSSITDYASLGIFSSSTIAYAILSYKEHKDPDFERSIMYAGLFGSLFGSILYQHKLKSSLAQIDINIGNSKKDIQKNSNNLKCHGNKLEKHSTKINNNKEAIKTNKVIATSIKTGQLFDLSVNLPKSNFYIKFVTNDNNEFKVYVIYIESDNSYYLRDKSDTSYIYNYDDNNDFNYFANGSYLTKEVETDDGNEKITYYIEFLAENSKIWVDMITDIDQVKRAYEIKSVSVINVWDLTPISRVIVSVTKLEYRF